MARKNFFQILDEVGFNAANEYDKLYYLFTQEACVPGAGYFVPLVQYVNDTYFRMLSCRGTYTSINEMMTQLAHTQYASPLDRLFVFCEFLIAVLPKECTEQNAYAYKQAETIMQNITVILEQTNYELTYSDGSGSIITEKNYKASQAVELVTDKVVAQSLLEYNHFAIEGNLSEKRKILFDVGSYVEPILRSHKLQQAGYRQLESDMGFLLNNFHVRHNNKEGAKAQTYIQSISAVDLETWYDKIYNTALAVIIISEQIDINAQLSNLKETYTWKT